MTEVSRVTTDREAYAKMVGFNKYTYTCIEHLMTANEDIWKLLKYNDPDAWNKANLTMAEKRALIYNGQPDETLYRVFRDAGQVNAWIHECCVIRIYPYAVFPDNRTINTTTIIFDVYTHYRINHLSNYTTRNDTIAEIIMNTFNGTAIGGLGRLFFNVLEDKQNRLYESGQIPYKGFKIAMSTKQV